MILIYLNIFRVEFKFIFKTKVQFFLLRIDQTNPIYFEMTCLGK
jgi:hypothetical protein